MITAQVSAIEDRGAGGQGGAVGIDEAAAVAGNTGGVGNDDLGPVAGHFHGAAEQAGVAGVDLIENDARSAIAQIGIGLHPAAELGLHIAAGVIENRALLLHIELRVIVARDAGSAGRLDIDLGQPIGRRHNHRLLVLGCAGVGHDLAHRRWQGRQPGGQQ